MKRLVFTVILIAVIMKFTSAQVTFILKDIPVNTPLDSYFFLAGTINKWVPNDIEYQFNADEYGRLVLNLDSVPRSFEYKICRGNWNSVEVDSLGRDISNRLYVDSIDSQIFIKIHSWRDLIPQQQIASTASPNVFFTPTSIEIPQFKRRRTVRVYFPPNYSSRQAYPVIYMFDGQNVFDASTSFAGEWKVDETLDSLYLRRNFACIVVAVYHGEGERINEQTPWPNDEKMGGDGAKFAQFFVKDLKPYIDKHYRTFPDRDNTIIIGSSLGGLMALYMALQYPEVFGKAGVFSPSLWWSEKAFEQMGKFKKRRTQKIYILGGEQESDALISNLERAEGILKEVGFDESELNVRIVPDGHHSEWFWAREFPDAIKWLFGL
jgi:alpha-glucosidase